MSSLDNSMKEAADHYLQAIRDRYGGRPDSRIQEMIGDDCVASKDRFDVAGAEFYNYLYQFFAVRNGEGRDAERRDNLLVFLIQFGDDLNTIENDLRAFFFWKSIFPIILEQRCNVLKKCEMYEVGGEFAKDPCTLKIMLDVSEKNVKLLMSIFDMIKGAYCGEPVLKDDKYLSAASILESDLPVYKKALIVFIELYYLINRYGIIIGSKDLEELKKDADEWALESYLTPESLSFIKGLSDRIGDD